MKLLRSLAVSATLFLAGAGAASAATSWDLPLAWPAGNYIVKEVQRFAEEVKKATDGEVVITTHPSGSLGFKGPEMLAAVRDGLVPIGDMLLNQQVGVDPLLGLESLPFLIDDFEGLQAFGKHYRPLLDEVYARYNQKILFRIPWPQQQIFTKKEIRGIEDLQGLKIRSYDKSSTDVFAAVGMNPVQLPWGDVIPSLAAGAIEAVATSSPSAVDGSFWELLKYGYPTRQTWNTNVISVNLDAWNKLDRKHQDAIVEIANRLEPEFWATAQSEDGQKMETLAKNGMVNGTLSAELRAILRERSAPIREAAIRNLGEKAKQVVDAFEKR